MAKAMLQLYQSTTVLGKDHSFGTVPMVVRLKTDLVFSSYLWAPSKNVIANRVSVSTPAIAVL